jgi:hypothetical protein
MLTLGNYNRPNQHLPAPRPEETLAWMAKFIKKGQYDARIRLLAEEIVSGVFDHDYLSEYAAILNWVRTNIRYTRDPRTIEQLKEAHVTLETAHGDCMTLDTKIIVRDSKGYYRLKTLGSLKEEYVNYEALSYNFNDRSWEFKPITAWGYKGEQEVYRVRMANGYSFKCTHGHKLYGWLQREGRGSFECRTLADLCSRVPKDESGDLKFKQCWTLLCAKQIPALDKPGFEKPEESWLAGAYLAEGWSDGARLGIAKTDPADRLNITDRLDSLGMSYLVRESRPNTGGYVSVHRHPFQRQLCEFGGKALEKALPENFLSGSAEELSEIFKGYMWGDSWTKDPNKKYKSHIRHVAMHSTVSHALSEQIKFLYLIFGRPLSGNLVQNHGGLGKNPIWRLWEATGQKYYERLPDLTNIGIKRVQYAGVEPVCDITVKDNNNFVLANGALAHNCDDLAIVIGAMVGQIGGQIRLVAGAFKNGAIHPKTGKPMLAHVWVEAYDPTSSSWVVLDPVPGRRVDQMLGRLAHTLMMPVVT